MKESNYVYCKSKRIDVYKRQILCIILGAVGVFHMDYSAITSAAWINIPFVTKDMNGVPFMSLPKFELGAILSIAPIACVTFMEHIGDVTTNGTVVGKDFLKMCIRDRERSDLNSRRFIYW